jgi:hypothetical protein
MPKLRRLLRSQQLVPFREWLAENELAYGHDKKNAPLH